MGVFHEVEVPSVSVVSESSLETQVQWVSESEASSLNLLDFSGKSGQVRFDYPSSGSVKRKVYVGVGSKPSYDIRKTTHATVQAIKGTKTVSEFSLVVPSSDLAAAVDQIAQVIPLSDYKWDENVTLAEGKAFRVKKVELVVPKEQVSNLAAVAQKASTLSKVTCWIRDLNNTRSDIATPQFYEDAAQSLVDEYGLKVTVIRGTELRDLGCNMIWNVGRGARVPPRLIFIEYNGDSSTTDKIGVVGKTITFDTGGQNIKMTGFIEAMYLDMCGGGATLGTMRAVAELKPKLNVVGVMCAAENSIGSDTYPPSSILKSYKGLSVEIKNTDAEGRLALGDGLSYLQKNYSGVKKIVDMATLTGAAIVALGEHLGCVYDNQDGKLAQQLVASGKKTNERCWHMPLIDEYKDEMKGDVADLINLGKEGRSAGSCTAAAFLSFFIEEGVEWAHIDLAGPAMMSKPRGYFPAGATGYGVQLIYDWITSN